MSYSVCKLNYRGGSKSWTKKWKNRPNKDHRARRLLTHPGVGPVTALATEVFLGDPRRFATANQVASNIGMIPCEQQAHPERNGQGEGRGGMQTWHPAVDPGQLPRVRTAREQISISAKRRRRSPDS
jgi:hypothetical protein